MNRELLKSELHDQSTDIGEQLATYLSARREAITAVWMAAVEHDAQLPSSENLTLIQLRNHIPKLFLNLSDTLRNAFNQDVKEKAAEIAAQHGEHRWKEGYDLSELIREFAHIRTSLIYELVQFEALHPDFGGASRLFAQVTLHRFLDDAVRNSVEQFHKEHQPGSKK